MASVQAQDKQGVAGGGPAVKAQGTEKPNTKGTKPDKTPAPTAAQQGGKPAPKGDPLTAKAQYYIREDLKAQRRMAVATEKLIKLTETQTGLVRLEVWLLAGTLLATAIAAVAAAIAAGAANKAVGVASETAKRQLRAYVYISKASIQNVALEDKAPTIHITFKNSGETPAYSVLLKTVTRHFASGQENFDYSDAPTSMQIDVGKGQEFTVHKDIDVDEWIATRPAINIGVEVLYTFGEITYLDAFDKPQHTKFRFYLSVDGGLRDRALNLCDGGNESS